jgi:hypothetical protein
MQHLPDGATVAPIIIGTDKTNLMQFSGGKCAYPVYLTLGNLPRAIRRKPSEHACILIAYLSPEKCRRGSFTKNFQRARNRRLFHESMHLILDPLKKAAEDGVEMTGGDGAVRLVFPILTSYVADYPEQCLVTCTKYGTCPKCKCPANDLQNPTAAEKRSQTWVLETYVAARKAANLTQFGTHCMAADITPCAGYKPFWVGFPWSQIHMAITPDVMFFINSTKASSDIFWVGAKKHLEKGSLIDVFVPSPLPMESDILRMGFLRYLRCPERKRKQ